MVNSPERGPRRTYSSSWSSVARYRSMAATLPDRVAGQPCGGGLVVAPCATGAGPPVDWPVGPVAGAEVPLPAPWPELVVPVPEGVSVVDPEGACVGSAGVPVAVLGVSSTASAGARVPPLVVATSTTVVGPSVAGPGVAASTG